MSSSWASAEARLGFGMAALYATALPVRRDLVGPLEARTFRLVNDLSDTLYRPAWVVMQLGALAAAPTTAGVAYAAGRRELAGRLVLGGTVTWGLAKVVKRLVRRGRPEAILTGVHCRGPEARGHGYLSGHAAVATALVAAALPQLSTRYRQAALAAASLVGLSRIYVGAHLPLDVAGGIALGLLVDAALGLTNGVSAHSSKRVDQ